MIKSILKTLVLSAIVLLIGQINIGSDTVAGHFERQVKKALKWSGRGLTENALVARLSPTLTRQVRDDDDDKDSEAGDDTADGVTAADRDSLIRLLQ